MRQILKNINKQNLLLCFVLSLEILFILFQAFNQRIQSDENEHLYGAYMVFNGYIPYLDFFEHHNPLLWYLTAPLYLLFENDVGIYYAIRIITFILTILTAYYTYKLSTLLQLSKFYSILSACFYLSFDITKETGIQFRPDVPMALLIIMGLYYFILSQKYNQFKNLFFSFLCFSFSFFFLQKAAVFILPIALYIFYLLIKKRITLKIFIYASLFPIIITFTYLAYLYLTDTLKLYYTYNYLGNMVSFRTYDMLKENSFNLYKTPSIILCLLASLYALIIGKNKNIKLLAFYSLICFYIVVHLIYAADRHYMIPLLPLFSIVLSHLLQYILNEKIKEIFMGMFFIAQVFFNYQLIKRNDYPFNLFIKINTLITENSTNSDEVMIHVAFSGIKKQAAGYYYFGEKYIVKTIHSIAPIKEIPNPKEIIMNKKPKIICDFIDIDSELSAFITKNYTSVPIREFNFWIRKDIPRILNNVL